MNEAENLRRAMEGWDDHDLYNCLATNSQQYRQWAASAELQRRKDFEEDKLRKAQLEALGWQKSHSQRVADSTAQQAKAICDAADKTEQSARDTADIAQSTLTVLKWTLIATSLAAVGQIASVVVTLVRGH